MAYPLTCRNPKHNGGNTDRKDAIGPDTETAVVDAAAAPAPAPTLLLASARTTPPTALLPPDRAMAEDATPRAVRVEGAPRGRRVCATAEDSSSGTFEV